MSLDTVPTEVDVVVVGGGINGACAYHELTRAGYRVLLIDRGDFASGTSAASAMMIWGGLLYLKDWEILMVARLCASRDELIARQGAMVRPRTVRYIPEPGGRSRAFVQAMLHVYWLLGGARRRRPTCDQDFEERSLLRDPNAGALTYEEASLETSDARFVLSWILRAAGPIGTARNYCALEEAAYDGRRAQWLLRLADTLTGSRIFVSTRMVINAAGGWSDAINAVAGLYSPYRHVLSRGISVAVPRDRRHQHHLAFDNGVGGGAMSLVPWGPVSLWGSTDTVHPDMASAQQVDANDLRFLLTQLNRHLARPAGPADVVSIRCGVRAVVVRKDAPATSDATRLSRRHKIHLDTRVPWVTVYGGKLSGCSSLAREVRACIASRLGPGRVHSERNAIESRTSEPDPPTTCFPGLDRLVVDPAWSAAHEQCRTIEDYLRRRTNIAQWCPRGGLGAHLEHLDSVRQLAAVIHGGDHRRAASDVDDYQARVDRDWGVLQRVTI